jgi:predicted metal-dependent hydrolase
MASKKIELAGIGSVTLVKSSLSRSLRLTVSAHGVRVSMPNWTNYSAGAAFALSHQLWIENEVAKLNTVPLEAGQRLGKLHYLRFEQVLGEQPATARVTKTEVIVRLKSGEQSTDLVVQKRAKIAIARALKREAELLLPPRLASAAQKYGLTYTNVAVKSLKRRWGSCSSNREITFNLYLMELSWEYIRHELHSFQPVVGN